MAGVKSSKEKMEEKFKMLQAKNNEAEKTYIKEEKIQEEDFKSSKNVETSSTTEETESVPEKVEPEEAPAAELPPIIEETIPQQKTGSSKKSTTKQEKQKTKAPKENGVNDLFTFKEKKKKKNKSFTLDEDILEKVESLSKTYNISQSEIINTILKDFFNFE